PPFTSPLPPTSAPQGMAPPATDPRRSRSDEILDGAAELFAEYGYHGSSLRDISHQVGISHPGMLHHFASKDALLGGVIDRLEAHAQAALDRVEELCTDPEVFVRALAESWHPGSHSIQLLATRDADAVSDDHPGRVRMARLRRVHEHILQGRFPRSRLPRLRRVHDPVLEACCARLGGDHMLREGVAPTFAARVMMALVLSHAVRENTVRVMQTESHDDAPVQDLMRLAGVLLLSAPSVEDAEDYEPVEVAQPSSPRVGAGPPLSGFERGRRSSPAPAGRAWTSRKRRTRTEHRAPAPSDRPRRRSYPASPQWQRRPPSPPRRR